MTTATLLENFDLLMEAPNAVVKMRELVLELAVRGRLVEQDDVDEPATDLLARINNSRENSSRKGSRRIPNSIIEDAETPFVIPPSWCWSRVGNIAALENGDRGKNYPSRANFVDDGIPFINAGHLKAGRVSSDSMNYISPDQFALLNSGKVRDRDILFCLRGSLGKTALVEGLPVGAIASSLVIVRPAAEISARFLMNYFSSLLTKQMIRRFDNGTAQPNLSSADLSRFLIPLPPLPEQHRIVAKVDQLMSLCDELERRQQARRESRDRLRDAALDALTRASEPEDVAREWGMVKENLDLIVADPSSVVKIRELVLELAVKGSLAHQLPEDGTASFASRMTAQLKGKKQSKFFMDPPVDLTSGTQDLVEGWTRCRLGDCMTLVNGRAYSQHELLEAGTPVIRIQNLNGGKSWYYSDLDLPEQKYCHAGDLLFAWSASFGPYIWDGPKAIFHYHIWRIELEPGLDRRYAYYLLTLLTGHVKAASHGLAMLHMTKEKMEHVIVALPPLPEQHRIVAKVDQLMSLCDDLESKLRTAERDAAEVMEAIVRSITGGGSAPVPAAERSERKSTPAPVIPLEPSRTNGSPSHTIEQAIPAEPPVALAAEPVASYRAAPTSPTLFDADEEPRERPRPIEDVPVAEVMAAFRRAARGAGRMTEEDLLRDTALLLGYRRLGPNIRARLKGHLRAAVRRAIVARDGDRLLCATPTIAGYDTEELLRHLLSVMTKGYEYQPGDLVGELAEYLGYSRATAAMGERVKEVVRMGKRRGVLGGKGKWVWREG